MDEGKTRREEVSQFSVKKNSSHSAKKFRTGIFSCVNNFGYREILCSTGLSHDFLLNYFCLKVPKFFVEAHFCVVFQKTYGSEKVYG